MTLHGGSSMAKKKSKKKGKGAQLSDPQKDDKLALKNNSKEKQQTEVKEYEEVRPKG
jgi:hypothetical protein